MNLFYQPFIHGKTVKLDTEESRHILKVLRKSAGDEIHLTDGMGSLYTGLLTTEHSRQCEVEIVKTEKQTRRDACRIHIAIAPTKNTGRFEWFLEKATEIGVDEITPLICRNSERDRVNAERLKKVLISAMKQSLKVFLPELNPAVKFREFIEKTNGEQKFLAYIGTGSPEPLVQVCKRGKTNVVLIGPEGDFSPDEAEAALSAGYTTVSLGESRLRTETAGVVACHTISLLENVNF